MADPTPPPDDHIEDLLSQLQGIFGRLSHSEDEEPSPRPAAVPRPAPSPKEPAPKPKEPDHKPEAPTPVLEPVPEPVVAPTLSDFPAPPDPQPEPESEPTPYESTLQAIDIPTTPEPPMTPVAPIPAPIIEIAPTPPPVFEEPVLEPALPSEATSPAAESPSIYQSQVPEAAADNSIVPTAVFFPMGRDAEARALAQKLETMTPKFTKVAFRLRVATCLPYDPRGEWKNNVVQQSSRQPLRSVFVVVDRSLEENRKRDLVSTFESQAIYFQEVPLTSIEKKAFYTDLLLGLVFFFDSLKPHSSDESA